MTNAQVFVDEKGGLDDTLKVDDSGDSGSDSGFMTKTMIFGVGMGGLGITYTNSESLEILLSQGGTTTKSQIGTGVSITNFTVYSVLATTPALIQGGKGNDIVYVGAPPAGAAPTYANVNFPILPAGDDGDLNNIQAPLAFNGGGGSDYLEATDHADTDAPPAGPSWNGTGTAVDPDYGYNYIINPYQILNDPNTVATVPTPDTPPARTFAGITYYGVAFLELTGTDATNKFSVTPSTTTSYLINAELPQGSCRVDMGDYLQLNTTQIGGGNQTAVYSRTLHMFTVPNSFTDPLGDMSLNSDGDPSYPDDNSDGELASTVGNGYWSFPGASGPNTYAMPVYFLSIEQFNHVAVVAKVSVPPPNSNLVPTVTVSDAETGRVEYIVQPYPSYFHGGINVTVGDVNCDGLPDLVVAPQQGFAPLIEIYDGTPDVNGNYAGKLINSFYGYNQNFLGGLASPGRRQ